MSLVRLAVFALIATFTCSTGADEKSDPQAARYVEPGYYSIVLPKNFTTFKVPGQDVKTLVGKAGTFRLFVSTDKDVYAGDMKPYIAQNIKDLESFPKYRGLGQKEFKTDDGLVGTVLEYEYEDDGKPMRNYAYLFRSGDQVRIMSCLVDSKDSEQAAPLFASLMKTLRIEK